MRLLKQQSNRMKGKDEPLNVQYRLGTGYWVRYLLFFHQRRLCCFCRWLGAWCLVGLSWEQRNMKITYAIYLLRGIVDYYLRLYLLSNYITYKKWRNGLWNWTNISYEKNGEDTLSILKGSRCLGKVHNYFILFTCYAT